MNISYSNDSQRGPGHGILTCSDLAAPGQCHIALERASDHLFLGNNGEWAAQQSFLPVAAEAGASGEARLRIGPSIVNQLDVQERYRVHVKSGDGPVSKALLQVRDVAYSAGETLQNAAVPPPPPVIPRVPEGAEDSAKAAPQPSEDPRQAAGAETAEAPVAPAPVSQGERRPSSAVVWVALGLLLLAAAGVGAWYFLLRTPPAAPTAQPEPAAQQEPAPQPAPQPEPASSKPEPEPEPQTAPEPAAQPAPEPQPEPEPAPQPTPEPAAQPEPAPAAQPEPAPQSTPEPAAKPEPAPAAQPSPAPAPAPSAEERVRLFFGGQQITPEAAAKLSRELPKGTPTEQDAVYRLYYFAAEHGEGSVLMDYAACLDPAKPQWGSINKDAVAAFDIYEKAKATQPAAAEAQRALRAWLEQRAAAGEAQARYWLQQLP